MTNCDIVKPLKVERGNLLENNRILVKFNEIYEEVSSFISGLGIDLGKTVVKGNEIHFATETALTRTETNEKKDEELRKIIYRRVHELIRNAVVQRGISFSEEEKLNFISVDGKCLEALSTPILTAVIQKMRENIARAIK